VLLRYEVEGCAKNRKWSEAHPEVNRKWSEAHPEVNRKWSESHPEVKQEKRCTYNVTMRRVNTTIVAVAEQKLLRILSVGL
jgi:hypothetical protein